MRQFLLKKNSSRKLNKSCHTNKPISQMNIIMSNETLESIIF